MMEEYSGVDGTPYSGGDAPWSYHQILTNYSTTTTESTTVDPTAEVLYYDEPNAYNLSVFNDTGFHNGTRGLRNCNDWLNAQHVLFQLANLCFCVSFLAPSSFRFHMLLIRTTLTLGCLFLVLWGGAVVCQVDILTWYLVFLIINATHLGLLLCKLCPARLHPLLEDLYFRSFKPFRVSRYQFKELTAHAQLKDLPAGDTYALESSSKAGQRVSILIAGRLKVTYENVFLHYVEPCTFVDSPEYEAVPNKEDCDTFQVSISALEESLYLSWPTHQLQLYLKSKPFLSAVFTNIVGKDITHKLYQVQELLVSRPENLKVLASRNSIVQVRQRLSQSLSTHSLHLSLTDITLPPADNGVANNTTRATSPTSPGESEDTQEEEQDPQRHRAATPEGPYSPSQVSFETCV